MLKASTRVLVPEGWSELPDNRDNDSSHFSCEMRRWQIQVSRHQARQFRNYPGPSDYAKRSPGLLQEDYDNQTHHDIYLVLICSLLHIGFVLWVAWHVLVFLIIGPSNFPRHLCPLIREHHTAAPAIHSKDVIRLRPYVYEIPRHRVRLSSRKRL